MQRAPRYPPPNARLIRLEEGPPMYRMLGYADRNNLMWDLTHPRPPGFEGPFAMARPPQEQAIGVGPGRFGLPSHPLAFTTVYWDDSVYFSDANVASRKPLLRMFPSSVLPTRPEAEVFPEMAVPGTGVMSRFRDSGYVSVAGLDSPHTGSDCFC